MYRKLNYQSKQMSCMILISTCLWMGSVVLGTEYHVAPYGSDINGGSVSKPFKTISAASAVAHPGDMITVHEGIYREEINPPRGGTADNKRITYQASPGENVEIRGSEVVTGWAQETDSIWKVEVPTSLFGNFNPFADEVSGDWFNPKGRKHHTGCVYQDGEWLFEAASKEELKDLKWKKTCELRFDSIFSRVKR